jgi:hypothetical protein
MTWAVAAVVVVPACLVGSAPALALNKAYQYGASSAAYWQVGDIQPELSRLCRRGQFNQIFKDGLYIGFGGRGNPGGVTVTGIAKRGFNLRDPLGKAVAGTTYHFKDDGYSTCRVYEAIPLDGAPPLNGGAPPANAPAR